MVKIKTKLLIIVIVVVLFVNSYDLKVFANTDYDHDVLLEYEGYGQAMYETVVEQTTFINGRYTENKEYVSNTIDQIKDYAGTWWNEYSEISNLPPKEKLRALVEFGGGYALTVGDWVKKLFNSFGEENDLIEQTIPDYSFYDVAFRYDAGSAAVRSGYTAKVYAIDGRSCTTSSRVTFGYTATNMNGTLSVNFGCNTNLWQSPSWNIDPNDFFKEVAKFSKKSVSDVIKLINQYGGRVVVIQGGVEQEMPVNNTGNKDFSRLNNYIKDNPVQKMVTPQPKAYLSCPDGTRINMAINGGTFLDVKGQVMQVNTDGTATVDSQLCQLGWEKPTIQYIDGTDQVGITTPDGKIIDAETGEPITGEFDDSLEGCDGVLCAIGKLLSGLGSIAKAIAAIPLKILDGLLELVKKIFIPQENFWTTNLDGLKNKFFHDELKEVQNGVESLETVAGGQFGDVTGSLMGVDNLTIVDSSSINMSLEKIHSWVRGFFYPLLLFFNINQMYRVIRGTSLIGIGGKKEE